MSNTGSGSLAARAVLAVVLMVGFYLLALAVAGLLLFVIYLEISGGRLNIYLTLLCLFAAGVIIWSIIPRPERFKVPGPALEPDKYPKLFAELKSISQAVNQEMPARVYLLPEANAYVSQVGGFSGLGSRRIMGIGLPLISTLSVSQLRSVLAHEFGHYYSGDTKLGPWIYRTRSMVIRTVSGLHGDSLFMNLIRLPFYAYGKMFLRITLAVSRRQEYNADKLAAQLAGSNNTIQALRTIHGVAPAWDAYWREDFAPAFSSGFVPPLAGGFAGFLKAKQIAARVSDIVAHEVKEAHTNPYDSHPSLKDRIAALEALPVSAAAVDDPPATSLIHDTPQLEMAILQPIAEKHHLPALKTVTWDEVTQFLYIPGWQKIVQQQQAFLKGITPEKFPEIAAKPKMFEDNLVGADGLNPGQRSGLLFSTLGAALTLALWKQGWQINTAPGEPVIAYNAGQQVECFDILPRLRSSALLADAWLNNCRILGITGLDLSQAANNQPAS